MPVLHFQVPAHDCVMSRGGCFDDFSEMQIDYGCAFFQACSHRQEFIRKENESLHVDVVDLRNPSHIAVPHSVYSSLSASSLLLLTFSPVATVRPSRISRPKTHVIHVEKTSQRPLGARLVSCCLGAKWWRATVVVGKEDGPSTYLGIM